MSWPQPGDIVRRFAALKGWPIAANCILVEGEHDQRYFALAGRLHCESTGFNLITPDLSIFPTGIGDAGGAFGLQRHFHPLREIMDVDVGADGRQPYFAIAIFDNDLEGKRGFSALTGRHLVYRKWRDVFILHRSIPRTTRDPAQVERLVEQANAEWRNEDCEIEDMLSAGLVTAFIDENSNAAYRRANGSRGVKNDAKARFCRFVEQNAMVADVRMLIEALKSFRYFLGLNPDGILGERGILPTAGFGKRL